ncbi:FIP1[V]-like protein [Prunus yedoensis var. nudiflora]|uniref:FIP1[V]-like protein n=1 Tax=Prunus yedoensis var. nudiflora TaxID=2094558 RepID=A0A314ZM36_PRUYE|nr:FIP1[V]-like protein [Prunus yedoensis var. nudiflora]
MMFLTQGQLMKDIGDMRAKYTLLKPKRVTGGEDHWRSEVLHWTEDQLTVRDHGDKLYSKKGSVSYQKYVRNETFHVKYGSSHDAMHIDDMLPEQHRLKMMRKRSSAKCMNRSSMMGKHEQTIRGAEIRLT